jgi:hypothetical protein
VTADDSCLGALGDKPHAHLGHPLTEAGNLIPNMNRRLPMYCNRTATGLIRASTHWTK